MTPEVHAIRKCKCCSGPLPCLPCRYARQQRWADANRERVRAQKAAYEQRYPDRVSVAKSKYYKAHRSEAAAYKAANYERINRRYREQYAEDSTPFRIRNQRRDAREKAVGGTFTAEDLNRMMVEQGGLCANPYCRASLAVTRFQADHKVPVLLGGSHDPSNRQLLCPKCNHRKGTLTNEQWMAKQDPTMTKVFHDKWGK